MRQTGSQRPHPREAIGSFQVLFEFFAMFDIAQKKNRALEVAVAVMQRRDGHAHRDGSHEHGGDR